MTDHTEREVVRQESVGPAAPVTPVTSSRTVTSYRSYDDRIILAVWWVVGFLNTIIAIRFLLKLFGASTQSSFVRFMYDITAPLVAPFHGIFNTVSEGRAVLEPESLVAMVIYTLIGWGIISLIRLIKRNRSSSTTLVE
jgi:uncharacterized protein YggT (Ycf19 family)